MVSSSIAMMPQRENTGVSEALTRVRMCRHRGGFIGSANAPPRMTLSGSYVCFPKSVTAGARCYTSPAVHSLAQEFDEPHDRLHVPSLFEEDPRSCSHRPRASAPAAGPKFSAPSGTVGFGDILETAVEAGLGAPDLWSRWWVYGTIRETRRT